MYACIYKRLHVYVCIHIDRGMPRCLYSHCDTEKEQFTSIKGVSAHTNTHIHTHTNLCMYVYICVYTY